MESVVKTKVTVLDTGETLWGKMGYQWRLVKKNRQAYILMAPYMLLFAVFTILPVIVAMVLSFTYFNGLEMPRFIGWANYIRLFFEDDLFLVAVKNTLFFATITGPVSYIACLIFAWFINELSVKLRTFLTFVFYAPSLSGNAYLVWSWIFTGDSYGIINGWGMKLGLIREPIQWLLDKRYIMPIIIVVSIWMSLGTAFLAFIAGFQNIDKSMYEAAAIDGISNRWQELWFITLPAMKNMMLFGAIVQITHSLGIAGTVAALAGNPSTDYAAHTVMLHLQDYGSVRYEMGYASSIAFLLFCTMIFTQNLVQKLLNKVGK